MPSRTAEASFWPHYAVGGETICDVATFVAYCQPILCIVEFSSFLPADVVQPTGLLHTLLTMSLTAIAVLRPLYAEEDATIRDFAWVSLNPAGQRMLALPACPTESLLTLFPHAQAADGDFPMYLRAFATGELGENRTNYQADGVDGYFLTVAQRYENVLVVNFTDTNDQPRSAVEQALRDSQAAEKAARAEAETQRQRFYDLLMQLPAQVAVHEGADHVFTLVNPGYQRLAPGRVLQGQPIREARPELVSQGILDVLDHVYQTGEPFIGKELPFQVDFTRIGQVEQVYNAFFLPLRDEQGQVRGVLDFSTDVTEQVEARQRVEQLNQRAQVARAEAEAERQRLYQVLMRMPANIALLRGPEHIYDLVNAEYEHLFPGRSPLGHSLREVIPELEGQGFYELFDRVYETGEPFHEAETEAWADYAGTGEPQRRYYRTTFEPIRNAQGQVTEVLNFAVDITAQVEARQQVEQLNRELETRVQQRTHETLALQTELLAAAQRQVQTREAVYQVFEQTTVAVALLRGPDHRYEYVNPAYRGFAPNRQLVGRTVAEELPELYTQGFGALLDHVYQTGETYLGVELPFTPDPLLGEAPRTSYFNFTYQAYYEAGQMIGVTIIALDVTEQVLARQEREAQRRELEQLFMQAPTPIVILDGPDRVFQVVNPAYQRIFPGRALAGKPLLAALPELVGTPIPDLLQRVYQTGEGMTVQELPLWMARHEGHAPEEIYWTFAYQARRAAHGTIDGVHVFAHDVTEQVRTRQRVQELNEALADTNQELAASNEELMATNEELNESNTQLTRTNVDLDNFIYTASHDLKAPITNIEGLLLALEHELPAAARTGDVPLMLTLMQDAVDRFRRTITHLTDLSRLQKEHNPASDAVALAPVVEAVRLDLTPLLAQTQGQLTVTIPAGLTVTFAEKNLRSVVYNLLSNAFKYCHPDRVPEVQLRSWVADGYTVLEVQDNGLGLDLAQGQEKLFAMFQRLHTHVEGTGVGLYMVKRILENAGGRIEVASQLGQGSTFRVYFQR